MTKFYVSGPMTGYPEFNFPAFARCADELRAYGHVVLSAHEIPHVEPNGIGSLPWHQYLRDDIVELVKCSSIVLLPGWEKSKGARLEAHIASELGMTRFTWSDVNGLTPVERPETVTP